MKKSTPRLRVGQPITPDQFDSLSDAQLARLVPQEYRDFFPGKDFCADGSFYCTTAMRGVFTKAVLLTSDISQLRSVFFNPDQAELVEALSLSDQSSDRLRTKPRFDTVLKIAKALGVRLSVVPVSP